MYILKKLYLCLCLLIAILQIISNEIKAKESEEYSNRYGGLGLYSSLFTGYSFLNKKFDIEFGLITDIPLTNSNNSSNGDGFKFLVRVQYNYNINLNKNILIYINGGVNIPSGYGTWGLGTGIEHTFNSKRTKILLTVGFLTNISKVGYYPTIGLIWKFYFKKENEKYEYYKNFFRKYTN
jgi:hypothetical protein